MHSRDGKPVFVEIASNRAEERRRDGVRCVRGKAQPNVIIRRERVDRRACRANLRVYILAAKSKQFVEDTRRHLCVAKQGDCGKRIRHIADERSTCSPSVLNRLSRGIEDRSFACVCPFRPSSQHRPYPFEETRRRRNAVMQVREFEVGVRVHETGQHGHAAERTVFASVTRGHGDDAPVFERDGSPADRNICDRQDPISGNANHCVRRSCFPRRLLAS